MVVNKTMIELKTIKHLNLYKHPTPSLSIIWSEYDLGLILLQRIVDGAPRQVLQATAWQLLQLCGAPFGPRAPRDTSGQESLLPATIEMGSHVCHG